MRRPPPQMCRHAWHPSVYAQMQNGVQDEDQRAEAHAPSAAEPERLYGVPGEHGGEDHGEVPEVPVDVLQDQREAGLSRVAGTEALLAWPTPRRLPHMPAVRPRRSGSTSSGSSSRSPGIPSGRSAPRERAIRRRRCRSAPSGRPLGQLATMTGGVEGREVMTREVGDRADRPCVVVVAPERCPGAVGDEAEQSQAGDEGLHPPEISSQYLRPGRAAGRHRSRPGSVQGLRSLARRSTKTSVSTRQARHVPAVAARRGRLASRHVGTVTIISPTPARWRTEASR